MTLLPIFAGILELALVHIVPKGLQACLSLSQKETQVVKCCEERRRIDEELRCTLTPRSFCEKDGFCIQATVLLLTS
jgi:hypothetical protein